MRTLRHFTLLTRLVLAWFVLSLGVAVASPIVKPQDILLVCTGSGAMKVLVKAADGSTGEVASNSMDCPLCASLAAPPPVARLNAEPAQPLAYALQAIPAAHIAARTAAPLPARGPPTS
ncbi:MAG: DUF2946 family protein [Rhodoferax sp.]|jgi:hypothetical protein